MIYAQFHRQLDRQAFVCSLGRSSQCLRQRVNRRYHLLPFFRSRGRRHLLGAQPCHSTTSRFFCRRHCGRLIRCNLVGIARAVATSTATVVRREGGRGEETRVEGVLLRELVLLLSEKIASTSFALGVFPAENGLDCLPRGTKSGGGDS